MRKKGTYPPPVETQALAATGDKIDLLFDVSRPLLQWLVI